jgi:hypothetical protein
MAKLIATVLLTLALCGAANAQELDLSHPLYQEEMQGWDYSLLMDCSIKYDITVDIYKSLANDPEHFKEAIARWNDAHLLFDSLAISAAKAQGLSDEKILSVFDTKREVLLEPVSAAGDNKKALADIAVHYVQDAKDTCATYFDVLKLRIDYIHQRI